MSVKPHLPLLIISAAIIVWYIVDFLQDRSTYRDLIKDGVASIGVIQSSDYRKVTVAYLVEDSLYSVRKTVPFSDLEEGEKYTIYYDKESPQDMIISYSEPHFDEQEYILTDSVKVRKLVDGDIEFSYIVNGKKYKRTQRTNEEMAINDGYPYQVYVNKENPTIAYLNFIR